MKPTVLKTSYTTILEMAFLRRGSIVAIKSPTYGGFVELDQWAFAEVL